VYIILCDFLYADSSGVVTVSATAAEAVNTNVTIYWTWEGDSSNTVYGTTTITTGNTYGVNTSSGASDGESGFLTSVYTDPYSSGAQVYDVSSTCY
jgi:hypothetical protein